MSCVPDTSSLPGSADRLLATVSKLTDEDLAADSALPGWTRAHVLTHIAQAADSRTGLLLAARAGRVGRQYASEEARAAAVEAGHAARRKSCAPTCTAPSPSAWPRSGTIPMTCGTHPGTTWPGAAARSAASSAACAGNWNITT